MSTKNPRINVVFEEKYASILSFLAKSQNKSLSATVKDLTLDALDRIEDRYFSELADKLDKPGVKTHSHEDAWK